MSPVEKIRDQVAGLWSLLKGLRVTGAFFVGDQVTVHYPRGQVRNLNSFRGPIELVESPEDPRKPRCIACMTCVSVCPDQCITVVRKRPSQTGEAIHENVGGSAEAGLKKKAPKGPDAFAYDYTRCCLCGLCVENCPVHSIRFSNRGYLAGVDREAFFFDLLEPFNATGQD